MDNHLHNELRKEFQLERLVLFSDAVFAIAITLLVIEIKIPNAEELKTLAADHFIPTDTLSDNTLLRALEHLLPKFIGFLISFMLIGQYWIVHHRLFGYVINFNSRLISLNIYFLLAIALMPFSTGFYSEYAGRPVITPVIFYTANITLLGIVNFMSWQYIGNPKHKLSENLSREMVRYSSLRAATVPAIFIVCSFVYYWSPVIASFIPATIPIILRLVFRPMRRKMFNATK